MWISTDNVVHCLSLMAQQDAHFYLFVAEQNSCESSSRAFCPSWWAVTQSSAVKLWIWGEHKHAADVIHAIIVSLFKCTWHFCRIRTRRKHNGFIEFFSLTSNSSSLKISFQEVVLKLTPNLLNHSSYCNTRASTDPWLLLRSWFSESSPDLQLVHLLLASQRVGLMAARYNYDTDNTSF